MRISIKGIAFVSGTGHGVAVVCMYRECSHQRRTVKCSLDELDRGWDPRREALRAIHLTLFSG